MTSETAGTELMPPAALTERYRRRGWKRFLSLSYIVAKVRERGVGGALRSGTRRAFLAVVRTLSHPLLTVPLAWLGVRTVRIHAYSIGHLAIEPDCYLKERLVGLRGRHAELVLAPRDRVVNGALLDYWRRYLRIVTSPLACDFLTAIAQGRRLDWDVDRYGFSPEGTARAAVIQRAWGDRPPLLALSDADRARGRDCLRRLGVAPDAWFVCVHCREHGYWNWENARFRNADIATYVPAMRMIVEQGGWCVRVGDPTMKPLPVMDGVVDYAHSDLRSEWMDIFLFASCRFFLGSNSGPYNVATAFGVPCGIANLAPLSVTLLSRSHDAGIPKLVWSRTERRYLTFAEMLGSPVATFFDSRQYDEAGLDLVDNSPDEIRALAAEMLEQPHGGAAYTPWDEQAQARFRTLFSDGHYSYGASGRVGRDFLRTHTELL